MDVLERHDLGAWLDAFLAALYAAHPPRAAQPAASSGASQIRLAKRPLEAPSRRHE
jgi:hypothetical protein